MIDKPRNVSGSTGLFWFTILMFGADYYFYTGLSIPHGEIPAILCFFLILLGIDQTLKKTIWRGLTVGFYLLASPLIVWGAISIISNVVRFLLNVRWDWSFVILVAFLLRF